MAYHLCNKWTKTASVLSVRLLPAFFAKKRTYNTGEVLFCILYWGAWGAAKAPPAPFFVVCFGWGLGERLKPLLRPTLMLGVSGLLIKGLLKQPIDRFGGKSVVILWALACDAQEEKTMFLWAEHRRISTFLYIENRGHG